MSNSYDDPRFGVSKYLQVTVTSSLAGTSAATELRRYTVMEATTILDWNLRVSTGGTSAGRQLLIGYSVGGTGTTVNIGTQALGTHADNTVIDSSLTQTSISEGDDIVISVLGTAAGAYVVEPVIKIQERFVNA